MLHAISPVDGRYADKTASLRPFFSEFGLIRYRVRVEVAYFQALAHKGIIRLDADTVDSLSGIWEQFGEAEAQRIKDIERQTNHDVKAVEYFLREEFLKRGLADWVEFIHFGLTSQDVNNTAIPLSMKEAVETVLLPELKKVIAELRGLAHQWKDVPMLARTHGQPASPTRLGKELMVFVERLDKQLEAMEAIPYAAKFGGATGNFNAHVAAFPKVDWLTFADEFCQGLGLDRSAFTTQIEHYDMLAAQCQALGRIGTILTDLCRDIWTYISQDYFRQKVLKNEVGSSAMPHKVNPIDFENAEGNLGMAIAVGNFMAQKLPISRLQRDLTDSTVLRNIGLPYAYTLIACLSIRKGLSKLVLHEEKLRQDLDANWAVLAEPIQTILRREGYPDPYNALKGLTRGSATIDRESLHRFIDELEISEQVKEELRRLRPETYVGIHPSFS